MSFEGMWCFVSGDVHSDLVASGGVVILDTQRIYGGDSAMAYFGRFATINGVINGEVESFRYNSLIEGIDVFGQEMGPVRSSTFQASLQENGLLVGTLIRGNVELPLILKKLRDLP